MRKPEFIDMKGLLSFHILWILKQRRLHGEALIKELGRRRDDVPSPGTLYPALNKLIKEGLLQKEREDKRVVYSVTPKGTKDLEIAVNYFRAVYSEIIEKPHAMYRSHSYSPAHKKTSERDDLGIDFI